MSPRLPKHGNAKRSSWWTMDPQIGPLKSRGNSNRLKLVSTENRGLSGAQNNAFPLSQGDYIQYLDADDLLAPDKIERQLAALREFDSKPSVAFLSMGSVLLPNPPCPIRSQFTVPRSFSRRVAFEKDARKPSHAKCNLASEPGAGGGSRTMGYSPSFRSRRRIFLPCTPGIRRYTLCTRDRNLLPGFRRKQR